MAVDVFAAALIISELRFGRRLFSSGRSEFHVLALMHFFIGPMPENMARKGMVLKPSRFKKVIKDKTVKIVLNIKKAMSGSEVASWKETVRLRKVCSSPHCMAYRMDRLTMLLRHSQKMLLNDKIDQDYYDLLKGLLEYDPGKRLSAARALQHPYFMRKIPLLLYSNM